MGRFKATFFHMARSLSSDHMATGEIARELGKTSQTKQNMHRNIRGARPGELERIKHTLFEGIRRAVLVKSNFSEGFIR